MSNYCCVAVCVVMASASLLDVDSIVAKQPLTPVLPNAVPPNLVMIIADDQSWTDFGFMGNPRVSTPNLDRLARQSLLLPNGYVPSSVCRPSLVTLLTGLYPHQHGVHFNHGPPGNAGYNRMKSAKGYVETRSKEFELIRGLQTLPGILHKQKGYRSLQTGKFWEGHYRNAGFTDGMTLFQSPPASQKYGGIRTLASGEAVAHGNGDIGLQIGRETMQPIYKFVNDCHANSTPWMLWYAPYLPHQPHDSPQRFYDEASKRPNVAEHELPYFASIAQFDHTVGQLISFVESKNLHSNTVFVFVCDNGWKASINRQRNRESEYAHTKRSKRAPFDDGLRTPILIRWDGVVNPQRNEALASSVDIVPTLLKVAGANTNETNALPGFDLLTEQNRVTQTGDNRAVYGAIYPGDATSLESPSSDVAYRWIRKGRYKMIVPHAHGQKVPWGDYLRQTALFDLQSDPSEQQDLFGSPKHRETQNQLKSLLDQWWNPDKAKPIADPN